MAAGGSGITITFNDRGIFPSSHDHNMPCIADLLRVNVGSACATYLLAECRVVRRGASALTTQG
jgi:hypothetical protein